MAKKHLMKKEMESDADMSCEDCGESPCACEGGACGCGSCGSGSCGGCGSGGGCGCGGYGGSCGCGCGMYYHKTKFLALGLVLFGILWYLKNTNVIPAAYFWPIVFVLAGVALFAKHLWTMHKYGH